MEYKITQSVFKKYPLWFEILSGILLGILNSSFSTFFGEKIASPIFMDTIFAITAAFIGWWSGILSVITFATLSYLKAPGAKLVAALFVLCVFIMILITRITFRKKERVSFLTLFFVYLLCVFFVSLSGAIISTYAFNHFEYPDFNSVKYLTMIFTHQHVPLILSSFLSRIPVNAVDKLIAVFCGYGIYYLIEKFSLKVKFISE